MCQFWLFSFEQYYPSGGFDDFVGVFDTLDAAIGHAVNRRYEHCDAALSHDISVRQDHHVCRVTENERKLVAEHSGRCPVLDKGNMTFRWEMTPDLSKQELEHFPVALL